ncbi:MAG: hypothetical protein JO257_27775 [Deltaproteobacteria bacterium]|nr:hypothetical protein [Deltaproteobacteria bacterium]
MLALLVAAALVGLYVLSRDSPRPAVATRQDAVTIDAPRQDARATVAAPAIVQDAPPAADESPQLRAVRSSGTATEPWATDAAGLVGRLAPGATTTCFVAGCIVEVAPASTEKARAAFAADTTWTGGKQWIDSTLILYRPD